MRSMAAREHVDEEPGPVKTRPEPVLKVRPRVDRRARRGRLGCPGRVVASVSVQASGRVRGAAAHGVLRVQRAGRSRWSGEPRSGVSRLRRPRGGPRGGGRGAPPWRQPVRARPRRGAAPPGHRRARAPLPRPWLRPRDGGGRHLWRHGGDLRRGAGPGGPRGRGGCVPARVRLVRRERGHGGRRAASGDAAPTGCGPCAVVVRPRRARGGLRPADPGAAAEHSAQSHGQGLHPRRAGAGRRARRALERGRSRRRGLRAPGVRRRGASLPGDAPGDGGAHPHGQQRGEDLRPHRLEGGLGHGSPRAEGRGAPGAPVRHLRRADAAPARGGRGAATSRLLLR